MPSSLYTALAHCAMVLYVEPWTCMRCLITVPGDCQQSPPARQPCQKLTVEGIHERVARDCGGRPAESFANPSAMSHSNNTQLPLTQLTGGDRVMAVIHVPPRKFLHNLIRGEIDRMGRAWPKRLISTPSHSRPFLSPLLDPYRHQRSHSKPPSTKCASLRYGRWSRQRWSGLCTDSRPMDAGFACESANDGNPEFSLTFLSPCPMPVPFFFSKCY